MRNLPVRIHCIPHSCQPNASYARFGRMQGVEIKIICCPTLRTPEPRVRLKTAAGARVFPTRSAPQNQLLRIEDNPRSVAEGIGGSFELLATNNPDGGLTLKIAFVRLSPCWSRTSPIRSLPTSIPGGFWPFPDGCGKPVWCCCSARFLPHR